MAKGNKPNQKILSPKEFTKKYPQAGTADILLPPMEKSLILPTRVVPLNYQLGGGTPYGKIIEILGYESTGKSLLAKDYGYAAQALGGVLLYGDAEGTFSRAWAEQNGLDLSRVDLLQDNSVELISDWSKDAILYHRSRLTKNEPIVLVLDSIAALECLQNIDTDQMDDKSEMGNRAKAIYRMYRKRSMLWYKYGVITVAINQVREKVNASLFENAETTPGGAATKFYASQRIALVRSKQIKDNHDRHVGQNIIIQTRKNKTAPPRGSLRTEVHFDDSLLGYVGYHRLKGLPDILVNQEVLTKKGSNYYFKGKMIARSEDRLYELLEQDEDLRRKLINRSGINTISKTRKKLESLEVNLFPVKKSQLAEDDE